MIREIIYPEETLESLLPLELQNYLENYNKLMPNSWKNLPYCLRIRITFYVEVETAEFGQPCTVIQISAGFLQLLYLYIEMNCSNQMSFCDMCDKISGFHTILKHDEHSI